MLSSDPLVSIIIPTFNREGIIVETLLTVQNQTYRNWECIIVDDFSTDNTYENIERQVKEDSRFILLTNQRKKGAPGARNTGIEKSKGAFLIFLDSDDLLSPDCLAGRIEKFQQHSQCDFLVFSTVEFKERIDDTNMLVNVFTTENVIERFLNLDIPWLIMAPVWRRESFLKLGLWNEDILSWQDWELHIRALLNNLKFLYFSKVDNYVRRDSRLESIGGVSISKEHLQSHMRLFRSLKPLMSGQVDYNRRLYGLAYWVANLSLEKGYVDVTKDAIHFLKLNWNYREWAMIKLKIHFVKKIYIKHLNMPDYGTMRKVYYLKE
ncbi:MAG: glycosyl transferase family 2 [Ferruginibacter sp.]|uniref:glycosyltransferase family 2 protein n=1 Tax=Ferruginibacter sp. TaxID=1940288 RepID=UPI0026599619|nr:glycosyltransferase family 2 protein [Ferruginibacter sp.]MDB5280348.1 glycosyl transferase family 2 [Ferruginibacter sp.]